MGLNQGVGIGDRRQFLTSAGAATLGIGAVGLMSSRAVAATAESGDLGVIQTALALEHEGIAAYQIAGKSGLLSPDTLKLALIFMGHHQEHRDSLARLFASISADEAVHWTTLNNAAGTPIPASAYVF